MSNWISIVTLLLGSVLQAQSVTRVALVGGTLIDGSGAKIIPDSVVLVLGERIQAVGTVDSLPVPANYRVISTEGMTVLPGLWDMHANLMLSVHPDGIGYERKYISEMALEESIMRASAEQYLMAGVTSVRDPLAPTDASLKIRRQIAVGEIAGPTYYTSGAYIEHVPRDWASKWRITISGEADAKAKINDLADKKVDLIMMNCVPDMPLEDARVAITTAHARGLKVAAHGRADNEIRKCLAADVDDFQHMGPTGEYPPDLIDAIRQRVKRRPLGWTVTVGYLVNEDYLHSNAELLDDPSWKRGLPPLLVTDIQQAHKSYKLTLAQQPRLDLAALKHKFQQLRDAGVEMMVGTDSGASAVASHSQGVWLEMEAWVREFGVPPMETIRRATSLPAEYMGVQNDYGTVSEGKFADIIMVHGDPLRHMDVLRDPVAVFRHGKQVK